MKNNYQEFVQSAKKGTRCLIKGTTGTGKTQLLLERYRYMINESGIPGDTVLVLLSNSMKLQEWKAASVSGIAAGLKCFTYNGFVQDELNTYYPLISGVCKEIGRKDIKPVFLGYEASKFLISKSVQIRRERTGAFTGLVSTSENVAAELIGNLSTAVSSGISYDEIGSRLVNALENKDEAKAAMLMQADEVMGAYRSKCLELGVFDTSMSIWLYNQYLLENPIYNEMLKKRIQHIIVDDLQDSTPVQIRFLENIAKSADTCTFALNKGLIADNLKAHAVRFAADIEQDGSEIIDLQKVYTCSTDICEFSEIFINKFYPEKKIENDIASSGEYTLEETPSQHTQHTQHIPAQSFIERHPPDELRSDMLQKLGERVCSLISEEGYKPSDIVILSTYADTVTELVLAGILKQSGCLLRNISRKTRFYDSLLCRSILTFAQLCHTDCRMFPSRDDLRLMCQTLFRLDPVRSTILARKIYNAVPFPKLPNDSWTELPETLGQAGQKRYVYIKQWMDNYIEAEIALPIEEFLNKAIIEIFLTVDLSDNELIEARKLVSSAVQFSQSVSGFGRNMTKDFMEMARNQAIMPESIDEAEDKISDEHVILSTPSAYLSGELCCKVAVICGLSSNNWIPGIVRELSNPYVLKKNWSSELVYTSEMDEINCKRQLVLILGALLKRCGEKIITFESKLSAGGFQNDGFLAEAFDEILIQ